MSNEKTLHQRVLELPDDDAVRLELADWWESHSEDAAGMKCPHQHAKYIRDQIETAQLTDDSPHRRRVAADVYEFSWRYQDSWAREFMDPEEWCRFSRGFVEHVELPVGSWRAKSNELFASHPLRSAQIYGLNADVAAIKAMIPENNTLNSLVLTGANLGDEHLVDLASVDQLNKLETLTLTCNWITDNGAEFICGHPFFKRLNLRLGMNPFSARGREMLRDRLGERVDFSQERGLEKLYCIDDEHSGLFITGTGKDHTQLLFRARGEAIKLAQFDYLGNLLSTQTRPTSSTTQYEDLESWSGELELTEDLIRVKRFQFEDGEGIYDFNWWGNEFEAPNELSRQDTQRMMERWIANEQYEWRFDGTPGLNNCWLDRHGQITDT